VADSLYIRDGDVFEPTGFVRGPWSYDHCHAGPPGALLTDAIVSTRPDMAMTRVTIDIPGPIPIEPVRIETEVLRGGKKVSQIAATLVGLNGSRYSTATAWLMRTDEAVVPATGRPGVIEPGPEESRPVPLEFWDGEPQYGRAVEIRAAVGMPFSGNGATKSWIRLAMPLLAGETPRPEVRVVALSDFPNGLSTLEPMDQLLCVNTDLTVYMGRRPIGEWIGFDSSTNSSGLGLGMTDSLLYDASGFIGTANQSIFFDSLNRREPEDGT
jgi:hypothetical protein